jgi:FAD/FMN-containing dehydrogenase
MTEETATTLEFEGLQGDVLWPDDVGYDEARAIYNGSIDKRPAVIVRPTCVADVIDAVNTARENGFAVAIRCGGHSVSGKSVCGDEGLMIDLSRLKGVRVDPEAKTARANAGVLWGEFDRDTQLFGLVTPGGRVTTTGVGGFTTGGGYAWLSAKYGLTCDNLLSADVVTADGRLVTASETENEDLFWGIRGGSSNFGLVTSFEFRLHELGPMVYAGLVAYPIDDAKQLVRAWRDYMESAPDELGSGVAILLAPPEEFVPPELHGKPIVAFIAVYAGDAEEGAEAIRPIQELGDGIDLTQPMPYTAFQAMIDPFAPTGWQNYHRGEHIAALPDEAIDAYVDVAPTMGSPMTQGIIFRHGGAVSRVPEDAMAASNRDAPYMAHPIACWQDAAEAEHELDWVRRFSEAFAPYKTGGVYLNFEPDEGEQGVRAGFAADKFAKLVALKDKWDPGNLFSVNANIRPSGT